LLVLKVLLNDIQQCHICAFRNLQSRLQLNLMLILDCQITAVTVLLCLFSTFRDRITTIKSISAKLIEVMVKSSCIRDAVYTLLFLFSMLFEASINLPIVHRLYATANILISTQKATARYLRKLRLNQ